MELGFPGPTLYFILLQMKFISLYSFITYMYTFIEHVFHQCKSHVIFHNTYTLRKPFRDKYGAFSSTDILQQLMS